MVCVSLDLTQMEERRGGDGRGAEVRRGERKREGRGEEERKGVANREEKKEWKMGRVKANLEKQLEAV